MNKNLIIKNQNLIPQTSKLNELLSEYKNLTIELESGYFERRFIVEVQKEMPNFCVVKKWNQNKLIIGPSISTQKVIENIEEFYKCIESFDKTAHQMMNMMSDKFNVDLNNPSEIFELKTKRSVKQRGKINDDWNYHFHGMECSFKNEKTNQFLDVKINNGLEFGVIDNYYLLQFINTSSHLSSIKIILDNQSVNMYKVIEVLRNEGYLIEYRDESLIRNRSKKPVANNGYN
ncbi:hypothetical protein [uncultured Tenacibaculum sp.]|uniref:DUF6896 domain-containing protein n=1 Tax=uncultured Tenacibaculum sp. TaxID=174713 RepID=UPI0026378B0B|nr:hypothetical protein [uncultured Tenacibaculum sp.]